MNTQQIRKKVQALDYKTTPKVQSFNYKMIEKARLMYVLKNRVYN
jgi:hypothetical protein